MLDPKPILPRAPERSIMNTRVRYIAEPKHVREVSLLGTADFAFWEDRLKLENLVPAQRNGRAQIWILASALKFMRIPSTEMSVAILVAETAGIAGQPSAFLIQSFNSFRPFVWCERIFFSIPSNQADCEISVNNPISIQFSVRGETALCAAMKSASPRVPSRVGEDAWAGAVFLPRTPRNRDGQGRMFFSRIRGHAQAYPFIRGQDKFAVTTSANAHIFRILTESQFMPEEWVVRSDATHSKSITRRRSIIVPTL